MPFTITESSGAKKAHNSFKGAPKSVQTGIRKGMYRSGKMLSEHTRNEMTRGSKSGKTYLIYQGSGGRKLLKPRLHRASSANEYPAVITGKLRASVGFKVLGSDRFEFGAGSNTLRYAGILEKSRRYLKQTVDKLGTIVENQISKHINFELSKKGINVRKV